MKNKSYQVWGDLSSEKSSENYPSMVLCENCVGNYDVVTEEGSSNEPCEECGEDCSDSEEDDAISIAEEEQTKAEEAAAEAARKAEVAREAAEKAEEEAKTKAEEAREAMDRTDALYMQQKKKSPY